jgi:hypothetical protein
MAFPGIESAPMRRILLGTVLHPLTFQRSAILYKEDRGRTGSEEEHRQVIHLIRTVDLEHETRPRFVYLL